MLAGVLAAQLVPQVPQLAPSELRFVSQPLAPLPSQLPQPALQACPQLLAAHVGAALVQSFGQVTPQPPQLFTSAVVLVSQPLRLTFSLALQSAKPALHTAMLQLLPEQAGVPFALLHGKLHAEQCAVLLVMLVSQPAAAVQSPKPALHAPT
jgi:hypothetical protein